MGFFLGQVRKFFSFSLFFVFNVGLLQPTAFKAGKFGFFLFASETFVFLVELYSKTFARALQRFFIAFNQINVIFLYIFEKEIIFIALSRVYFTLGGIDGPEEDQYFKSFFNVKMFLGPLSSDSPC